MTPAEVRAVFERYGETEPEGDGPWLVLPDDWYIPVIAHGPQPHPARYLPLPRLLAALGVAEALTADQFATVHAVVHGTLTTYRSTR